MNTNEIAELIKLDIPETRNAPQLMNSFMVILTELNRVTMRVNELNGANKLIIDIKIEPK